MPNTVITSTVNSISFVYNDDSSITGKTKSTLRMSKVVELKLGADYVQLIVLGGHTKNMSHAVNTKNFLLVDSVVGAAPVSLSDLYNKLLAIID